MDPTDDVSISAAQLRALITRVNRTKAEFVELSADGALVARVQPTGIDASFTALGDHGGVLPAVVVPLRALAKAAGVLDGIGYLSVADGYLVLRFGTAVVRIKTGDPMPAATERPIAMHITDAQIIAAGIGRVLYAAALDDNRYPLNGIAIERHEAGAVAVATDGNRLAWARIEKADLVIPPGYMLPTLAAEVIAAECRGGVGVRVGVLTEGVDVLGVIKRGRGWIAIDTGTDTVTAALSITDFPAWREVLPKSCSTVATFDRDAAIKAIKVAALYGPATHQRKHRQIVARVGGGAVVLDSTTKGAGGTTVTIPAGVTGGAMTVGVSSVFLLDALRHMPPGPVEWSLTTVLGPMVLTSLTDRAAGEAIVMPIRVEQ